MSLIPQKGRFKFKATSQFPNKTVKDIIDDLYIELESERKVFKSSLAR
jgi:hypothetical protein